MHNYRPEPSGGVTLGHPDGLYLRPGAPGQPKQILSVGPMSVTPGEILGDFPGHTIERIIVLDPPPMTDQKIRQAVLGRLFLVIVLAPDQEPEWTKPEPGEAVEKTAVETEDAAPAQVDG